MRSIDFTEIGVNRVILRATSGDQKERELVLENQMKYVLGRSRDCTCPLDDPFCRVSRHHCQIMVFAPFVRIQDLGSLNGTYLKGKEVESSLKELSEKGGCIVNHGDLLTIGGITWRVDILDCPHAGNASERESIGAPGETAKKDCPLPC